MTLFNNKYRIETVRLRGWDYSSQGCYFVMTCTRGMKYYFGDVVDGKMKRNLIGDVAHNCWSEIPKHFTNMSLGEFIVMPNHVHGIVVINEIKPGARDVTCNVSTSNANKKNGAVTEIHEAGFITRAIRSYKSAVTNWCHTHNCPDFSWQPRYYDRIIRNGKSLNKIQNYINNNPTKWEIERNNLNNFISWF